METEARHPDLLFIVLCPFAVRSVLHQWLKPWLGYSISFLSAQEILSQAPLQTLATLSKAGIQYP